MAERRQEDGDSASAAAAQPSGFHRWKAMTAERRNALWVWCRERLVVVLCLLLGLLLCVFLAVMASSEPGWAYWLFGAAKKMEILQFVGIAMGGVVLAIQAATAHKRAKALEAAAQAQAGAAAAQARANETAEAGQRQERFKTAIEHLGHGAVSVRLGGAYELFHLAADNKGLRETVFDILCAHIRQTTSEKSYRTEHGEKPSEEIQTLLSQLFVEETCETFKDLYINLQGSWLNGTNLAGAQLREADLKRVHLRHAELYGADLRDSFLTKSDLTGADLRNAHLDEARLWYAKLYGAKLSDADLRCADLREACLLGAKLERATLIDARLRCARLQGADLTRAELYVAHLEGAQLQATILIGTALQGAILGDTNMGGTGTNHDLESFEERIRAGVGHLAAQQPGAVFEGGLRQEELDGIVKRISNPTSSKGLTLALEQHVGESAKRTLPEKCGAITRAYTADEAEQWIAEYRHALEGGPEDQADGNSERE